MKKIVTIWWGNGQSHLLDAFYTYASRKYKISTIVSMSDDWRTTGELMNIFSNELGTYLPPPWDLRRCLFMMSSSPKREEFQKYLETPACQDIQISSLKIEDYFSLVGADVSFLQHLTSMISSFKYEKDICDFILPLNSSILGHKMGNILMANLFYNLQKDYKKMLQFMHHILEVEAHIIPVTTQRATIRAILWNGQVVESQNRISNVAHYSSGIADLQLVDDPKNVYQDKDVSKVIHSADYIVISPGDLFTSIISNFVIWGVREAIMQSQARVIYIWNSTNKWWETQWLTCLDFISKIERFLGRKIDAYICNNKKRHLSDQEKQVFREHRSIKGWDFLYLSDRERSELRRRNIALFESDLLDTKSLYKHDKKKLIELIESVMDCM